MTKSFLLVVVAFSTGACATVTIPEATRTYAKAIAEVADATKEDVNRCEHASSEEERTTFCGRAKKHCDVIQSTATELANSAK